MTNLPAEPHRWVWRARIVRPEDTDYLRGVVDGDTLTLELDRGLDSSRTLVPLRLGGPTTDSHLWVDAPELDAADPLDRELAEKARRELRAWLAAHTVLRGAWPLRVETWRTATDRHSKQTLARYTAHVWATERHAREYLHSANAHMRQWLARQRGPK